MIKDLDGRYLFANSALGLFILNDDPTAVDVNETEVLFRNTTTIQIKNIYPNPASTIVRVNIFIHPATYSNVKCHLFDIYGNKVDELILDNYNNKTGIATTKYTVDKLVVGVYFIGVSNGRSIRYDKFIVF